jgi:hypothetical protein
LSGLQKQVGSRFCTANVIDRHNRIEELHQAGRPKRGEDDRLGPAGRHGYGHAMPILAGDDADRNDLSNFVKAFEETRALA